MNLNALWSFEYATNQGDFGAGVAVLIAGYIYGGDTHRCYQGEYHFDGRVFEGKVQLRLHSGIAGPLCSNDANVILYLSGEAVAETLEVTAILEHDPTVKFFIHLHKQADLPTVVTGKHASDARADAVAVMVSPFISDLGHSLLIGEK